MAQSKNTAPFIIKRFTQRYRMFEEHLQKSDIELTEKTLDELSPKLANKYALEGVIANGGMKMILRLRDKDTARNVAMATLINTDADMETVGRFIREARITANLEHPNIVPIHELGVDGKMPYFTMKLIEGETLLDVIEHLRADHANYRRQYPLSKLIAIYRQVLNAMIFAHARGVVHLDLSPGNILIGRYGEVLVLDWGLAQVMECAPSTTANTDSLITDIRTRLMNTPNAPVGAGIAQGTPGYMSPEQAAGDTASFDYAADIYALGAILYTIVTLRSPIEGLSVHEMLSATVEGRYVPPKQRVKHHISRSLNAIIVHAMQTRPENRYGSVRSLRDDINLYLERRPTHAEHARIFRYTWLWSRRHVLTSITLLLLCIGFVAGGVYSVISYSNDAFHWGTSLYAIDLRSQLSGAAEQLRFGNEFNEPLPTSFIFNMHGYDVPPRHFLWFPEPKPYFDAKVTLGVYCDVLDFDLFFGANNDSFSDSSLSPAGLYVRFTPDSIAFGSLARPGYAVPCKIEPFRDARGSMRFRKIEISSLNGRLIIRVDGRTVVRFVNDFPPLRRNPYVAVRAGGRGVTVCSFTLNAPEPEAELGAFVVPEMLALRANPEESLAAYLRLAERTSNHDIQYRALLRYIALSFLGDRTLEQKRIALAGFREALSNVRDAAIFEPFAIFAGADIAWQSSEYEKAVRLLQSIDDPQLRAFTAAHLLNRNYPAPRRYLDHIAQMCRYPETLLQVLRAISESPLQTAPEIVDEELNHDPTP